MATLYDPDYTPRLYDAGGDVTKRWYIDYRIWDTDKQDFVRKQYTGMNKYPTLRARKKVSAEKLEAIKQLIEQGYTAGKAKLTIRPYDIRRLSLREAMDYFLNHKNSSDTDGNPFVLNETYNPESSIKKNTFKPYKNYRNQLLEWLESQQMHGITLLQFDVSTANAFFDYLKRKQKLSAKSHINYLGFLRSVYSFYAKREEDIVIRNPFLLVDKKRVAKSKRHVAYTDEQMERIKAHMLKSGDKQLYLFIHFIYYTFARPGIVGWSPFDGQCYCKLRE
jgi:integrase